MKRVKGIINIFGSVGFEVDFVASSNLASVTRFGKFLLLRSNFIKVWQSFEDLLNIWQNLMKVLGNF